MRQGELRVEGNRLFKVPLFAKAAEQYTAAIGKWKHPAFYFNLAVAQLNLGQDVEARDSLEHALHYGEAALGADDFKEAQKQLRELEQLLGRIRITSSTEGAEITIDGATLFATVCGWCHQDGGRAEGKGPKLAGTTRSDEFILNRIRNGKTGAMPAFAGSFSEGQIIAILAYIRTLEDTP